MTASGHGSSSGVINNVWNDDIKRAGGHNRANNKKMWGRAVFETATQPCQGEQNHKVGSSNLIAADRILASLTGILQHSLP